MFQFNSISKEAIEVAERLNDRIRLYGFREESYIQIMSLLYNYHTPSFDCFDIDFEGINKVDYSEAEKELSSKEIKLLLSEYEGVIEYCWRHLLKDNEYGRTHCLVNHTISGLCLSIAYVKEKGRVCIPYASNCDLLLHLDPDDQLEVTLADDDIQSKTVDNILCNAFYAEGSDLMRIEEVRKSTNKFDYIMTCPPFASYGPVVDKVADLIDNLIFSRLEENGDFFAVLPGFFYYQKGKWESIREKLVNSKENYSVDIIALPRVFSPHININMCLLHIKNDHQGKATLMDASGTCFKDMVYHKENILFMDEIAKALRNGECKSKWEGTIEELRATTWSPLHKLYEKYSLDDKYGYTNCTIGDIAEFKHNVASDKLGKFVYPVLKLSDLKDNFIDADIRQETLTRKDFSNPGNENEYNLSDYRYAENGDCIIYFANGICRFAHLIGDTTCLVDRKSNLFIVSLKGDKVRPEYLFQILTSENFGIQSSMLVHGARVSILSEDDFKKIKIQVPSEAEQNRLYKEATREKLTEADKQLLENAETFRRETHIKKHAIGQTVASLSACVNNLNSAVQKGFIDINAEIGRQRKTKVGDILNSLSLNMKKLELQLSKFDAGFNMKPEWFNLCDFISDYISRNKRTEFDFIFDKNQLMKDTDVFQGEVIQKYSKKLSETEIFFPKAALTSILDNIVSNACSHGFVGHTDNKIRIDFTVGEQDAIFMSVANNGDPFDEKILDSIFTYGVSSRGDKDGHYGIGGYEINKLMSEFDGRAFVQNEEFETDAETGQNWGTDFVATYYLEFKKNDISCVM